MPGITQPSSNLNPLQDVDVVTQKAADTTFLPAANRADTGNQSRNDTAQQNAFAKDTAPVSTGLANTDAKPPADQVPLKATSVGSFTAFLSEAKSEVARTVVEFKLSEPPPEQQVQDERTASLEAERGYQSQSFLEAPADRPRQTDLSAQAAQDQSSEALPKVTAERVAVAPLAPDL